MARPKKYPDELIQRGIRLAMESGRPIAHIAGEQRIARLLSAHTTCRLQDRSLHAYLIDVLTARAAGRPVPLLA